MNSIVNMILSNQGSKIQLSKMFLYLHWDVVTIPYRHNISLICGD